MTGPSVARSLVRNLKDRSGVAPDWIWLTRAMMNREGLRRSLVRWTRLRFSPGILRRIVSTGLPVEAQARLFMFVQAGLPGGHTYKETGIHRTVMADEQVVALCAGLDHPRVMEVGCGDGSAAVDLAGALGPEATLVLTDRYPSYSQDGPPGFRIFRDADGHLASVKILGLLYLYVGRRSGGRSGRTRIPTDNPRLRSLGLAIDTEPFDVALDARQPGVDVIKSANLLHRAYFTPGQIVCILGNLARSLKEGGHLVISHNNAKYPEGEAVAVFQKEEGALRLRLNRNDPDVLSALESPDHVALPA